MSRENKNINIGIIGGAGYTGGELIRLLIHHPHANISFVQSRSHGGKPIDSVHQDLVGETNFEFTDDFTTSLKNNAIDILFLCVGHGEARSFLENNEITDDTHIIDLSHDFRLLPSSIKTKTFVYGLPELNKQEIKSAKNIANPGCFATAIQLGLLPLAKEGLLTEVYSTGITGSTGAGQGLSNTSHFSWRANNIQAYKTLSHQHLKEINQSLNQLQPDFIDEDAANEKISFVPWRGDFTRGIFISSQLNCEWSIKRLEELYGAFYKDHPFTFFSREPIFLKQVVNTNKCVVQLEKQGNRLVIHSAIDNLLKGASGQAVQNMNLMFGLDECAGLNLKAAGF